MKRIEKILNGSRKINSKNVSIWSAVFAVTFIVGISSGIYWLQMNGFSKPKNGGKIAIIFNTYRNKQGKVEYEHLLELQTKYKIPATWVIDSDLIDTLKQKGSARDFFRQTKENKSNFIINIPNMDTMTYIDGLDSYVPIWKERIQFINENLAQYDDKLQLYTTHSSQIPQPIEDYLKENKISLINPWLASIDGLMYDYTYEQQCFKIEKGRACRDTDDAEKQDVRNKYLQHTWKLLDLRENFMKEKLGTEFTQLLSFTTNELAKNSSDELFRILQEKGYKFVPFDREIIGEAKKLRKSIWKDSEYSDQEFKLSKEYRSKYFNELEQPPSPMPTDFNIDITTKDFKPKGN